MANHCIYTVCSCCGHEYCVRCEFGICPKCGTPWNAKPMSLDKYFETMNKGEEKMTLEEIYRATCLYGKTDKMKLVNMILSSLTEKKPRSETTDHPAPTMPVHEAMCVFNAFVYSAKNVRYSPNGLFSNVDYRHMKELLLKINERMVEACVPVIDDAGRIEALKAFLQSVKEMNNTWYYDNRFTPAGLNTDFDKIYIALKTQRNHGKQAAFDYL